MEELNAFTLTILGITKAIGERDELKLEINELAGKVSDLSNIIYEKNQIIDELSGKLKIAPNNNREFNALNIQLNKMRKENEMLQKQIDDFKFNKRHGLSIKQEYNSQNILSMLKHTSKHDSQPEEIPIKIDEKENMVLSTSQTCSDKFESTQSNEDQTINESETKFPDDYLNESKDRYQEAFDIRLSKPIIQESIQLKSKNFDLPSSSPVYEFEDEYSSNSQSSPIKFKSQPKLIEIKKEQNSSQVSIVEDSQGPEENYLYKGNIPTPQTIQKFQTPKAIPQYKKRSNQLLTPLESETPLKKPKKKLNKDDRIDLTFNPKTNSNWAIEDFKVNPAKNQNITYAYHIVLRGKDRSCIHGTTCDDCEKFYRMAGELPNFEAIGPQWNNEPVKKFDIVSKTSRHKDLWERPESPPGFGDFDIPTTQEQKELNKKSDLMIRRTAYERLFSALNDKKYIFRDENLNRLVQFGSFKINENVFLEYLKKE